MIIELHNFGPIERFTFDTEKRMHFIFGENNVGKSYAITAVYLILKNWEKFTRKNVNIYSDILLNIKKKMETLEPSIDITMEFRNNMWFFINDEFIPLINQSFFNTFSSIQDLSNKHSRKEFQIIIRENKSSIILNQKGNSISFDFNFEKEFILKQDEEVKSSYIFEQSFIHLSSDEHWMSAFFSLNLYSYLWKIKYKFSDIFFLPASRSGIYNGLSAWSAILVQLTQLRNQDKNTKFEIPALTEPISDYFLNLTNIEKKAYSTSFSKFAKRLEDEIIKGKINFDKGNRKLFYEPSNLDISLELSQASSMISEIAPIIAHLKFIFANEDDTENGRNYIFIEEPEAHLHPKVQVALIQLFAEMAKEGLHVVMTSHSNYMFNKLSNMVLAKEIAPETISVGLMKLGKKGSYIDENAMHIDEDGIDDDNFSETAEALYNERLKLYEQNPS